MRRRLQQTLGQYQTQQKGYDTVISNLDEAKDKVVKEKTQHTSDYIDSLSTSYDD